MNILSCLALLAVSFAPNGGKTLGAVKDFYEHGAFQRAVEIISRQIPNSPSDANLRFWLGKSYYRLRKWDESIREFDKAVALEPGNSQYHLWAGRAYGKKAENSVMITALGPARRVLKEFEAAVKLAPDSVDARFDLLEFYLDAPGFLGGGKGKAQEEIRRIAQLNRRLGNTARARFYEKEKKWDSALKELSQSALDFPKEMGAHVDLADYLFRRFSFSQAADAAREALALGFSARAQLILAASRIRLGQDLAAAEQSLRDLIAGPLSDEDPPFEEVHYWLGQALLVQGRKSDARQAFELALSFNPDYAQAKSALAQAR